MDRSFVFFNRIKPLAVFALFMFAKISCAASLPHMVVSAAEKQENRENNSPSVKQASLPDSLLINAQSIVKESVTRITIDSESKMTVEVKKVRSVLNSGGDSHGYFYASYDNVSRISRFKGAVYDKNNERVLKYRKGDLRDYSLSPLIEGVTDARIVVLQPEYPIYPYTVETEYQKVYKGIFDIQDWYAIEHKHSSVKKAKLIVENHSGIPLRYKTYNTDRKPEYSLEDGVERLTFSIKNLTAIPDEPYSESLFEMSPGIRLALSQFSYDGHEGRMTSWAELGQWIYELGEGRDNLPPEVCNKIRRRVKGMPSDKERIKAVYDYMQERSRYVSIQLGIGGWQPFETNFVHEKGYGDCKALSFYTRSLLECADVDAKYTLVYAGPEPVKIDESFPANQFNHVILSIPHKNDTIWLECTNMNQPFNYLGSFTHNRKALIVDDKSSHIVQTPSLPAGKNVKENTALFSLNEAGDIKGHITTTYEGLRYDFAQMIMQKGQKDQIKDFYQALDFSGCSVEDYTFEIISETGPVPVAKREASVTIEKYGKPSGNRIFFNPNVFSRSKSNVGAVGNRSSKIVVEVPKHDVDSIIYQIPENLSLEYVQPPQILKSGFGTYHRKIYANDSTITFVRKLTIPAGSYSAEKYDEFAEFRNNISKADEQNIVFISED